jgi:hypothetical protein
MNKVTEQAVLAMLDNILHLFDYPTPALQKALYEIQETPLQTYLKKMCQPL